jgi:hypothetical protein
MILMSQPGVLGDQESDSEIGQKKGARGGPLSSQLQPIDRPDSPF